MSQEFVEIASPAVPAAPVETPNVNQRQQKAQAPPPPYSEVPQIPNVPQNSYQQNVRPQTPVSVSSIRPQTPVSVNHARPQTPVTFGHYPHEYAQNYQSLQGGMGLVPNPYTNMNYGPPQYSNVRGGHPPFPRGNFPQHFQGQNPRQFNPRGVQQFPNPSPHVRPPHHQQNPYRKPQNKQNHPTKPATARNTKVDQKKNFNPNQKAQRNPKAAQPNQPATPQTNKLPVPQISNNQMILNLEDLSKFKNSSIDADFTEFSKHLNKTKFKPLGESRKSLVNNKYLSDVKFVIGDEIIYGHKLFLATSSAKFHKHFHVEGNVEMKIEGINKNTFIEVISYCYTGQLKISEENVLSVLLAANLLEVRQLTNTCSGFINNKISPDTIFVIFEKAIDHKVEEFQKKCLDFITKHEEQCFVSKGFYEISLPSLMAILNALKFTTEKSNQLIEKWTNGCDKSEELPPDPKPTGAVKKQQKIPSLLDFPPPPAEFSKFYETQKPIRPFADLVENLINFDDDEDASSGIICKDSDDDLASEISFGGDPRRTTFVITGKSENFKTEFSRVDFLSMKSINIHEIWFNVNLFASDESKMIRLTVVLNDEGKKVNVHSRVLKRDLKPGENISTNFPPRVC